MNRKRRALWLAMGVPAAAAAGLLGWWLALGRPVSYGRLGRVTAMADSSAEPGVRVEQVTLGTTSGRVISCLVRAPAFAAAAPRPPRLRGLLVAGGRRTGRRAALSVGGAHQMVVMSCDYPWAELVRKRGAEFAYLLPRTRAEILATPELLSLAADYLLSRADVDSSRFAAVGASLGVPPVAAWAARDTRARAVALLYGGADLGAILEANLGEDIRWPALRAPVAGVLGFLLRPLEPAATVGGIAPRPLLVAGADSDQWIPRRSVELMFAAAREPKQLVWFGGEHLRTTNEALIAALGDTTAAWLSRVLP